jgi:U3 small nucleolar RNA-associated protein 20
MAYLRLLSSFVTLKGSNENLMVILKELLTRSEEKIQNIAIDCILKNEETSVCLYKEHLKAFCSDKEFKDEVVKFTLDQDLEHAIVKPEHREVSHSCSNFFRG